jgi:phytoene dehydrogenase-like protein
VNFMNQAQVSQIEHDDAVRCLVLASGEKIDILHVVSTITPAETERLLRGTGASATLHKWKSEARAITGACLDLCLRRLPKPDRHFVLGVDKPLYFSNHSKVAKLTEDGSLVIHLVKYQGTGNNDVQADERQLEQLMDLVQPGWRKEVIAKQFLPHMTIVHDYLHTGKTDLQPGPTIPEIRGLYVAGDWASHGEMLADAAAASAKRAAVHILQELEKDVELRMSGMGLI